MYSKGVARAESLCEAETVQTVVSKLTDTGTEGTSDLSVFWVKRDTSLESYFKTIIPAANWKRVTEVKKLTFKWGFLMTLTGPAAVKPASRLLFLVAITRWLIPTIRRRRVLFWLMYPSMVVWLQGGCIVAKENGRKESCSLPGTQEAESEGRSCEQRYTLPGHGGHDPSLLARPHLIITSQLSYPQNPITL